MQNFNMVRSSFIKSIKFEMEQGYFGFESVGKVTLVINNNSRDFHKNVINMLRWLDESNDKKYEYQMTFGQYWNWINSKSKGKFYNKYVK